MKEIILVVLAFLGVISLAGSYVLIALGERIDGFFPGDGTARARSVTGPRESIRIAVVLFWILFIAGAWAILQEGIVTIIMGITLLFAICLFLLTALAFSFSVLSAMSRRNHENRDTTPEESCARPPQ